MLNMAQGGTARADHCGGGDGTFRAATEHRQEQRREQERRHNRVHNKRKKADFKVVYLQLLINTGALSPALSFKVLHLINTWIIA